jgi:alpha-L-fucosidase
MLGCSENMPVPSLHPRSSPIPTLVRFVVAGLAAAPAGFAASAATGSLASRLAAIEQVATAGPFQPEWASLENYQVPAWYQDGKFGIFIHWGVYSVPAFGSEKYPREMYRSENSRFGTYRHHLETYGTPAKFGYKDFIPMFKAERFDPAAWARLFRKAGARFVVPVAEHHDGFAMYDSGLSEWTAAKMGPKRDIIGELAQAIRAEGLVFGISSHRAEHWWFYDGGRQIESDVSDPRYAGLYGPARPRTAKGQPQGQPDKAFLDDWLARTGELVDKYRPQIVWFDWWIEEPAFEPYRKKFGAFYYNRGAEWQKGVALNYKFGAFPDRAGVLDIERGQLAEIRPHFWQTDTAVSRSSWGYTKNQDYKTVDSLIGDLVDIVSKNGALLLNVGPRADGVIPDEDRAILLGIGRWLKVNGEAIYGTRPHRIYGEGAKIGDGYMSEKKRRSYSSADIRYTTGQGRLYASILVWPKDNQVTIATLAGEKITGVALLGYPGRIAWRLEAAGLTVQLPVEVASRVVPVLRIDRSP